MKSKIMFAALFVTAFPTFGQQSTTNTNCMVNGQMVNCTSTTTPPAPSWNDTFNKYRNMFGKHDSDQPKAATPADAGQLSPEAIKELFAEEKQVKDAKDTVDFIYCRQNPKSGITDSEGKPKTCADVIAYTKAFCLVNPEVERCTLAKSKADVEKAFVVLADDYNTDPRRKKKDVQEYFDSEFAKLTRWGCMSFPDMALPQRDGTMHLCPDAPESTAHVGPGPHTK